MVKTMMTEIKNGSKSDRRRQAPTVTKMRLY